MKYLFTIITLFILTSSCNCFAAQNIWLIEWLVGDAHCFKTPLTITQAGFENINLSARYKTDSFEQPIYYAVRFSKWKNNRVWELEFIHLKIALVNKSPAVQKFEISHGFNLLLLNRGLYFKKTVIRLGVGIVIPHPENIVRGKSLSETEGILKKGYYLSGPAMLFGIGKRVQFNNKLFFAIESKMTTAYCHVPIENGHASVPNIAIHASCGLGLKL